MMLGELKKHAPEVQVEASKELLRRMYRDSLYLTTKCLLGYRDMSWPTHGSTFRALESATLRKLIILPRGTFKSSICSVAFPIWLLLRNPNLRILLDSEIYTNSKNFLREIKTHLVSEAVTELFGPFHSDPWNEGEASIRPRTIIRKEASLTASGIGAEKTGQHYDVIIADDLNSPSNSGTPEMRLKVIKHHQYNQAILDPGGIIVIVGTRYSANDIPGHVLATEVLGEE